jgi:hypothetical protein
MGEGEAFVIQAAADIAVRDHHARHREPTTPERRRSGGLVTRSWIESLVVAGAISIIVLMVVVGGIVAGRVASATASEAGPTVDQPDPLMLCSTVGGHTTCVHEPT